jgi:hypothetical protein
MLQGCEHAALQGIVIGACVLTDPERWCREQLCVEHTQTSTLFASRTTVPTSQQQQLGPCRTCTCFISSCGVCKYLGVCTGSSIIAALFSWVFRNCFQLTLV